MDIIVFCYCLKMLLHELTKYEGIRSGFCSTFTTFGNLIEDTGRLVLSGNTALVIVKYYWTLIEDTIYRYVVAGRDQPLCNVHPLFLCMGIG